MIVDKKMRVKGPTQDRWVIWRIALFSALIASAIACTTPQERRARLVESHTYEMVLLQEIQSYIYSMSCPALMPMAADLLWEAGYNDDNWEGAGDHLKTEWRTHDEMRRSRYEVMCRELAEEKCTVQFVRDEDLGETNHRRRDPHLELNLLQLVDEDAAYRIRSIAREEARKAYEEALELE